MYQFQPIKSDDPDFARRINRETGKMESICRYCYQTISASSNSDALTWAEMQHDCAGKKETARKKSA